MNKQKVLITMFQRKKPEMIIYFPILLKREAFEIKKNVVFVCCHELFLFTLMSNVARYDP